VKLALTILGAVIGAWTLFVSLLILWMIPGHNPLAHAFLILLMCASVAIMTPAVLRVLRFAIKTLSGLQKT
jgi:hypothetical protein